MLLTVLGLSAKPGWCTACIAMQAYTLKAINITASPKTGDKTYEHVKVEIESIEAQHQGLVIAVVSDTAGEVAQARRLLILWRPDLLTLDRFSHQFNLPVAGKPQLWLCLYVLRSTKHMHSCVCKRAPCIKLSNIPYALMSMLLQTIWTGRRLTTRVHGDAISNGGPSRMVDQELCALWHAAKEAA